jgi:hypothetical protein
LKSQSQSQDDTDDHGDEDHHEGEGSFMCAPVIWNDRFIVTASHPGEVVLFGDITASTSASASAASTAAAYSITKLSLESDASIVTIQVASATTIYLLSVEGHVHQVTLLESTTTPPTTTTTTDATPPTTTTTESSTSKSNVSLHLQASWNTNMCGATCMAVLHQQQQAPVVGSSSSSSSSIKKKNNPRHQLIIGYDAGYLECWNIEDILVEEEENKEDDDTNKNTTTNNNNNNKQKKQQQQQPHPPKPNLQWRGLMEDSIRSVCPLPRRRSGSSSSQRRRAKAQDDRSIAADEENAPSETQDDKALELELDLVITLQSKKPGTTSTSTSTTSVPPTTMMHVLDLGAVQNAISTNTPKQQDDKAISMAPYILLPAPGMELVDANSSSSSTTTTTLHDDTTTTRTGRLPKRVSTLSSRGTNGALALTTTTTSASTKNNGSWCCGVTLSDGTVAILSPGWGIRQDPHQLLLSYPAIGSGHIRNTIGDEQDDDDDDAKEYLVCCLRGGTCYLIPTTTTTTWYGEQPQEPQVQDIGVISYPQDTTTMDTGTPNTSTVYVQGFTAGTLQVNKKDTTTGGNASSSSSRKKNVSVLVYAWAGGVIDIYACGLQYPATNTTTETTPPTAEQIVLQELIDTDALSMVVQIFHKMDQNKKHPLHQDEQWVEARNQVKSMMGTLLSSSPRSISMGHLCSNELGALRGLLLKLASSSP